MNSTDTVNLQSLRPNFNITFAEPAMRDQLREPQKKIGY